MYFTNFSNGNPTPAMRNVTILLHVFIILDLVNE